MDKAPEEHWRELSEQILTDMKEWRRSHPKATFCEIEDEVHARMSQLEAQLIQDMAQQSKSRAWSGASPQDRPKCPVCSTPLQGAGGQEVTLSREYGTCPTCGTGLFPLDEELALQPGSLTPRQQEHLADLATWMPFARAAQMLDRLLGVQVSEPTVRRGTKPGGSLV